jgi:hypothetical protein
MKIGHFIILVIAALVPLSYWAPRAVAPNEPLAVDESLSAGRNRTFVDAHPGIYAPPPLSRRELGDARDREFREGIDRRLRERVRAEALDQLRRPGPALCEGAGRKDFIGGVGGYYRLRYSDQHNYAVRTPAEQAQVEKAWSTPLDQQIDGLLREFFVSGYFRRQDLRKSPIIDEVLSGAVPTGRACADNG